MKRYTRYGATKKMALAAVALTLTVAFTHAQVEGKILKKGGNNWLSGRITWKAGQKSYAIQDDRATYTISLNDVQSLRVDKPAGLDAAIAQVSAGQADAAIPRLQSIVDRYLMMQHDVPAAEALAKAYLAKKQAREARDVCKKVLDNKPADWITSSLVMTYWDALLAVDDLGTLNQELKNAIKTGSRPVVAAAYIVRGDINMKRNDPAGALKDGYLRVVLLMKDVKELRAEALFKAHNAFDKQGNNAKKDQMRKMLLDQYPQSRYAAQLR